MRTMRAMGVMGVMGVMGEHATDWYPSSCWSLSDVFETIIKKDQKDQY